MIVFQVGTTVSARVGEAGEAASVWSKGLQATITDLQNDSMHKIQGYRYVHYTLLTVSYLCILLLWHGTASHSNARVLSVV
jgi:hypothetical protein